MPSSDAPSAFGLGGTHRRFRVVADELTAWRDDALWIAIVSATGKVKDVQTTVLSNAGFDPERSWQWQVRETAGRADWGYLFSADGVIASWISKEWIEQMRELLPGAAFDRLIGNVWTSGAGDFVTAEQWARVVDERLAPRPRGSAVRHFGGLDLGLTKDRSALAILHRDGDSFVLDELQVWEGTRDEPVSITMVERAIADAAERFPGLHLSADPWQLKGSIERLRRERVRISELHVQSGVRTEALGDPAQCDLQRSAARLSRSGTGAGDSRPARRRVELGLAIRPQDGRLLRPGSRAGDGGAARSGSTVPDHLESRATRPDRRPAAPRSQ